MKKKIQQVQHLRRAYVMEAFDLDAGIGFCRWGFFPVALVSTTVYTDTLYGPGVVTYAVVQKLMTVQ